MSGHLNRFSSEGKGEAVRSGQKGRLSFNNLGICTYGAQGVPFELIARTLSATVGYEVTEHDIKETAIRGVNLNRAFNIRHGLTPADGGAKGSKIDLQPMLKDYYNAMGWDHQTGKPHRRTFEELGMEDVAKDLWE